MQTTAEFSAAFRSADKAGAGYLRLRHLRAWLTGVPSASNRGSASGLVNYYSVDMLGRLLEA